MTWRIIRLSSVEETQAILPEWEELAARTAPWHPFATPAWNMLWWKHYAKRRLLAADEFFLHIVRDENDHLIAVAPLFRRSMPGVGPLALRAVEFFGADPSITEIRGVICAPDDQPAVLDALRGYLCRNYAWDVWRWYGSRCGSTMAPPPGGETTLLETATLPDYVLPLPATWKDVLARVSSNMRKSVRKSYEFLERDGHVFTFRAVDGVGPDGAALEAFLQLHSARAAVADMHFKHPDRFQDGASRAFLGDLASEMARRRQLVIFELEIAGRIVASRLAFLHDRQLYLYYSGYDPSWRDYSIMTTLMAEILRWGISKQLASVNLSTGSDASKLRWQPEEIVFTSGVERRAGWRGSLLARAYDTTAAARRAVFRMRGYRSGSTAASSG